MWPLVSMYVFDELGRSMADAGLVYYWYKPSVES